MKRRRLLAGLGVVGLVAWAVWWGCSFAAGELIGARSTWIWTPVFGADFWSQTDYAARLWADGLDPYENEVHLFHYPPIVIRLFQWTPFFTMRGALLIWMITLVAILSWASVAALKVRRRLGLATVPAPLAILLVLTTFPALFAIERANFDLITVVAVLIALPLMRRSTRISHIVGGCVLAVGPWVKLYPGLMGVGLFGLRRFWTLLGFAIGGVGIGLLTPTETLRSFQILRIAIERNQGLAKMSDFNWWSHSLSILWVEFTRVAEATALGPLVAAVPGSVAAGVVMLPILSWVVYRVFRSPRRDLLAFPLLLWICALASFVPIIANDYSLAVLPIAALAVVGRNMGPVASVGFFACLPWMQPVALTFIPPLVLLLSKFCGLVAVGACIVARARTAEEGTPEPSPEIDRVIGRARMWAAEALAGRASVLGTAFAAAGAVLVVTAADSILSYKLSPAYSRPIATLSLVGLAWGGIATIIGGPVMRLPLDRFVSGALSLAATQVLASCLALHGAELVLVGLAEPLVGSFEYIASAVLLTSVMGCVGSAMARLLLARPRSSGLLYCAMFFGASVALALVIPATTWLGAPRMLAFAGMLFAVGGVQFGAGHGPSCRTGLLLAGGLGIVVTVGGVLGSPFLGPTKPLTHYAKEHRVAFTRWGPDGRVDIGVDPQHPGEDFVVYRDGEIGPSLPILDEGISTRPVPVANRLAFDLAPSSPSVLILAEGATAFVPAALARGAKRVTLVEASPVLGALTMGGSPLGIAQHSGVRVVRGDADWFLAMTDEKYDVIVLSPFAARVPRVPRGVEGTPQLTSEVFARGLEALTERGVLVALAPEPLPDRPLAAARLAATAQSGIERQSFNSTEILVAGVDPATSMVFVVRDSFAPGALQKLARAAQQAGGKVLDPSSAVAAVAPMKAGAVEPERPFFWHLSGFLRAVDDPAVRALSVAERLAVYTLFGILVVLGLLALSLWLAAYRSLDVRAAARSGIGVLVGSAGLGIGVPLLAGWLSVRAAALGGLRAYASGATLAPFVGAMAFGVLFSQRQPGISTKARALVLAAMVGAALWVGGGLPSSPGVSADWSLELRIVAVSVLVAPIGLLSGILFGACLVRLAPAGAGEASVAALAWVACTALATLAMGVMPVVWVAFGSIAVGACAVGAHTLSVFGLSVGRRSRAAP